MLDVFGAGFQDFGVFIEFVLRAGVRQSTALELLDTRERSR